MILKNTIRKTIYLTLLLFFFISANAKKRGLQTLTLHINSSSPLSSGSLREKGGSPLFLIQEITSNSISHRNFTISQLGTSKKVYKFVGFNSLHLKPGAPLAHIFNDLHKDADLIYSLKYRHTNYDSSYKDSFIFRDEMSYFGDSYNLRFHYKKALCFELLDSKKRLLLRAIRQGLHSNIVHLYLFQKKRSKKILPFVTTLIMMQISGTSAFEMRYNKVKF